MAIAVAVQVADVLLAEAEHAAAVQVLLHSLTPQAVVAVVVATVRTSAGTVTRDTLAVMAVVAQLDRTIVQLMEQAVVAEQVSLDKEQTELAVITVLQHHSKLDQAAAVVRMVNKEFQENRGVTAKDTAIIAEATMALVVAVLVQVTVVVLAVKALCVLYGQQLDDATRAVNLKIKNGDF